MSTDIKEAYVRTELHNGIATIEFFHRQSNALPAKILEQLAQAIHSAGNEAEVKVLLLRSGGDHAFCARLLMSYQLSKPQKKVCIFSAGLHT